MAKHWDSFLSHYICVTGLSICKWFQHATATVSWWVTHIFLNIDNDHVYFTDIF